MLKRKEKPEGFWANVREFAGLLLIVFLIRTFGFGLYQVPTGSMETTMLVGERFFADKFTPLSMPFKRGNIIAFNDATYDYSDNWFINLFQQYISTPWSGPANWTKRIVGIPGDTVEGKVEDGKPVVYLNGKKLDEPYLNKYPLIRVYSEDPVKAQAQAEQEILSMLQNRNINPATVDVPAMRERYLSRFVIPQSYDPNKPYNKQPFYRIYPNRIVKNNKGQRELIYPNTLINPAEGTVKPKGNYWNGTDEFYVKLGANQYWCMGDNRLGSKDCRFFGPIDGKLIHAKIIFRIWSIDSYDSWWIWDLIQHPIDFWSRVRWNRFFQFVH